MKFEDWFHEETERQQRCARSKAWNLAKNIYKLLLALRGMGTSRLRQQKSGKESLQWILERVCRAGNLVDHVFRHLCLSC